MILIAQIDVEQEVQPAAFGTLQEPVERAIENALSDLEVEHANGIAVIRSVAVRVWDGEQEGGTPA